MGQKGESAWPRVGVIKDWNTRWYADKKNFADNLVSDAKLRKMIKGAGVRRRQEQEACQALRRRLSLPSKSSAASTTKRRA